ncbi:hypothetical protein CDFC105_30003 [Clostridioides difficile]|nr:hypothetical protein CDFC105_30003 [Clostridioides difficile]
MKVNVYNVESFVDERLKIMVSDLIQNTKLKISVKMEFPWCKGEEFSSYGVFCSNEKGEVDLDLVEPIEGTYKADNCMGLIYSLEKSKTEGKNFAENISIDKPIIMNMIFETSIERKEVELKRIFKSEDITTKYISVSYTHLRAHETPEHLVCRLLLEKKKHTTPHPPTTPHLT